MSRRYCAVKNPSLSIRLFAAAVAAPTATALAERDLDAAAANWPPFCAHFMWPCNRNEKQQNTHIYTPHHTLLLPHRAAAAVADGVVSCSCCCCCLAWLFARFCRAFHSGAIIYGDVLYNSHGLLVCLLLLLAAMCVVLWCVTCVGATLQFPGLPCCVCIRLYYILQCAMFGIHSTGCAPPPTVLCARVCAYHSHLPTMHRLIRVI